MPSDPVNEKEKAVLDSLVTTHNLYITANRLSAFYSVPLSVGVASLASAVQVRGMCSIDNKPQGVMSLKVDDFSKLDDKKNAYFFLKNLGTHIVVGDENVELATVEPVTQDLEYRKITLQQPDLAVDPKLYCTMAAEAYYSLFNKHHYGWTGHRLCYQPLLAIEGEKITIETPLFNAQLDNPLPFGYGKEIPKEIKNILADKNIDDSTIQMLEEYVGLELEQQKDELMHEKDEEIRRLREEKSKLEDRLEFEKKSTIFWMKKYAKTCGSSDKTDEELNQEFNNRVKKLEEAGIEVPEMIKSLTNNT